MGGNSPPFPGPEFEVGGTDSILPAEFSGKEFDLAVQSAFEEKFGPKVRPILLHVSRRSPLLTQGDLSATLVRGMANGVYIDPLNLDVLRGYVGEQLDVHTRISEAADPYILDSLAASPPKFFGFFLVYQCWRWHSLVWLFTIKG